MAKTISVVIAGALLLVALSFVAVTREQSLFFDTGAPPSTDVASDETAPAA